MEKTALRGGLLLCAGVFEVRAPGRGFDGFVVGDRGRVLTVSRSAAARRCSQRADLKERISSSCGMPWTAASFAAERLS